MEQQPLDDQKQPVGLSPPVGSVAQVRGRVVQEQTRWHKSGSLLLDGDDKPLDSRYPVGESISLSKFFFSYLYA